MDTTIASDRNCSQTNEQNWRGIKSNTKLCIIAIEQMYTHCRS